MPLPLRPTSNSGDIMMTDENAGKIGVSFALDEQSGLIVVKALAPGGAADDSGLCIPGDVLLEIDGDKVTDIVELYKRVAGPVGSSISLSLQGARGNVKKFSLVRRGTGKDTPLIPTTSSSASNGRDSTGSLSGAVSYSRTSYAPSSFPVAQSSSSATLSSSAAPISSGPQSAVQSLRLSGRLPATSDVVGVGVNFMHTNTGLMTVKSLLPGGPAALTGMDEGVSFPSPKDRGGIFFSPILLIFIFSKKLDFSSSHPPPQHLFSHCFVPSPDHIISLP